MSNRQNEQRQRAINLYKISEIIQTGVYQNNKYIFTDTSGKTFIYDPTINTIVTKDQDKLRKYQQLTYVQTYKVTSEAGKIKVVKDQEVLNHSIIIRGLLDERLVVTDKELIALISNNRDFIKTIKTGKEPVTWSKNGDIHDTWNSNLTWSDRELLLKYNLMQYELYRLDRENIYIERQRTTSQNKRYIYKFKHGNKITPDQFRLFIEAYEEIEDLMKNDDKALKTMYKVRMFINYTTEYCHWNGGTKGQNKGQDGHDQFNKNLDRELIEYRFHKYRKDMRRERENKHLIS